MKKQNILLCLGLGLILFVFYICFLLFSSPHPYWVSSEGEMTFFSPTLQSLNVISQILWLLLGSEDFWKVVLVLGVILSLLWVYGKIKELESHVGKQET